MSLTRRYFLIT